VTQPTILLSGPQRLRRGRAIRRHRPPARSRHGPRNEHRPGHRAGRRHPGRRGVV